MEKRKAEALLKGGTSMSLTPEQEQQRAALAEASRLKKQKEQNKLEYENDLHRQATEQALLKGGTIMALTEEQLSSRADVAAASRLKKQKKQDKLDYENSLHRQAIGK